ncbi:hypothetical protein [Enterobacter hormaechei]|uniref:hypothetical protein n=1 Tax=Enterobacter hormaechei TaxID=158836 RepID=UPI0011E4A2CE|nr:hypothetical protein [Enterobacter hormaechei]TYF47588.1 hypothetical protein DJ546_21600 [Enterobacter hormaechei]VAK66080.1 Uncharacterised protein [Enterobacter hormaechei]
MRAAPAPSALWFRLLAEVVPVVPQVVMVAKALVVISTLPVALVMTLLVIIRGQLVAVAQVMVARLTGEGE